MRYCLKLTIPFKFPCFIFFYLLLVYIFLLPGGVCADESFYKSSLNQEKISVSIEDDLLSVSIKDADIQKVFEKIAGNAGINININRSINKKISMSFVNVVLEDGIRRIMDTGGIRNYVEVSSKNKGNKSDINIYILDAGTDSNNIKTTSIDSFTHKKDLSDTSLGILSSQISSLTEKEAVLQWRTEEYTIDDVTEYGTTTKYGLLQSAAVSSWSKKHIVKLEGLKPATIYHYRIKCRDLQGNTIFSADNSFVTLKEDGSPVAFFELIKMFK